MTLFEKVSKILIELISHGYVAYLAGGCVRDMLLNITPHDYDIATSATPEQVHCLFPETIMDWSKHGVVFLPWEGNNIEIATFRKDGVYDDNRHPSSITFCDAEQDAKRRDFTINALFYNPFTNEIIDYVGGQEDLKNGIIRAVGKPKKRFKEDPLRMLRAYRFAAKLNFKIDNNTEWPGISDNVNLILKVSPERYFQELTKILLLDKPGDSLSRLKILGLLEYILPEIRCLDSIHQSFKYHFEDTVFTHIRKMLDRNIIKNEVFIWAILLHDIGKINTYEIIDHEIHFNGHEHEGKIIAEKILKRLKTSNEFIEAVCYLVENHMKFLCVQDMKKSTLKKFLRHKDFNLLLELHKLDCICSNGDLSNYYYCLSKLETLKFEPEKLHPIPLINGNDLKDLGFIPGPIFKEILNEIENKQLDEEIITKEEAIEHIMKNKIRYIYKSVKI